MKSLTTWALGNTHREGEKIKIKKRKIMGKELGALVKDLLLHTNNAQESFAVCNKLCIQRSQKKKTYDFTKVCVKGRFYGFYLEFPT